MSDSPEKPPRLTPEQELDVVRIKLAYTEGAKAELLALRRGIDRRVANLIAQIEGFTATIDDAEKGPKLVIAHGLPPTEPLV